MSAAVSPGISDPPQPSLVPSPALKAGADSAQTTAQPDGIALRIARLFEQIGAHSDAGQSQETENELARIVMLLVDVQQVNCDVLVYCLEVAVNRLLQTQPDFAAAKIIIDGVEQRLRVLSHPWEGLRRGSSPAAKVVFGMITFLLLLLATGHFSKLFYAIKPDPNDFHIVPLICCLGALGSFVSIMVRINEFAKLSRTDASVLFLTGFFKPWVGASFAFVLYIVLRSSGVSVVTEGDAQVSVSY